MRKQRTFDRADLCNMTEIDHPRAIRSYVIRGGRVTDAQERALERLWPRYGVAHEPQTLDLDALYGRRAPRVLEIGFGNGDNLVALASAHPERDYLGIEVHRPGVGRALLGAAANDLANVRVVCHDAVEVLERQIASESLDEILILFPDPWHKKRHHKRRLVQAPFAALAATRLKADGVLRIATDWGAYAEEILVVLEDCAGLESLAPRGEFLPRPAERMPTRFEKRGARLGHSIWDLAFRRRG